MLDVLGEDAVDIIRRPLRGHSLSGGSIPHEASIVGLTMISSSPTTFLPFILKGSVFDTNRLRSDVVPGKLRNAGVRQSNALRASIGQYC